MGVYGDDVRHTDESNPGTFTILMNQDYLGLHAEVGIQVNNGPWTVYPMSYAGKKDNNSKWTFTPSSAYPAGATVKYYFHGYDDWGGHIWDSANGANYTFTAGGGGTGTNTTIDVMVLYTPQARDGAGGAAGMQAEIDVAIAQMNDIFQRSQITNATARLVYRGLVNYNDSGDMEDDLYNLTGTQDGLADEAHTLRDTHGADLVVLLVNDGQYAGIAWINCAPEAAAAPWGFSVVHRFYASSNKTFTHELGHNIGCAHARPESGGGCTPYGFGHRFFGTNGSEYRTVMAYAPGERILHFSNPNVLYQGTATGVAGTGTNAADNARLVRENAAGVATFRAEVPPLRSNYPVVSLAGTFNAWNAAASNMTLVADNTWQCDTNLSASGTTRFKFAANGAWTTNWGDNNQAQSSVPLSGTAETGGADILVNGTLAGDYRFTFNDQTLAYSLELLRGSVLWLGNTYPWPPSGQITPQTDLWINTETHPVGAATNVVVVYSIQSFWTGTVTNMARAGQSTSNDWWHVNLGKLPAGTTVRYFVQSTDGFGVTREDRPAPGSVYTATVSAPALQWAGNVYHWPPSGEITSQSDLWINIESWPQGAATSARVVFSPNGGGVWYTAPMALGGQIGNNDWWHVNLGTFPSRTTIRYAIEVRDANGKSIWANNNGADYSATVK
jgi:hypothetical protein